MTREVMAPGWKWSVDVKPVVGTDFCRAFHQLFILSGRLHVVMEDGVEIDFGTGDAGVIPPGHDAWVVGDEPCEMIDFSPTYSQLIDAGDAYQAMTTPAATGKRSSRSEAAKKLRSEARAGRLHSRAVELVLGAVGCHRPRRQSAPAGLTPREVKVLVLIATGASAKQVAYTKTHIERIYTKCDVSRRSDATRFAIAHGLVNWLARPDADGPENRSRDSQRRPLRAAYSGGASPRGAGRGRTCAAHENVSGRPSPPAERARANPSAQPPQILSGRRFS